VGAIKGQVHEETKRAWLERGASPEQAEAKAQEAAAYGGENTDQIALGGVLGMGSVLGAERALSKVLHGTSKAAPGMMARVATTTGAETGTEMLQGGQEKFASNTALNRQGFDVDPMSGVIANATLEGAAAVPLGAISGIPRPAASPAAQAAEAIRATETLPESGTLTRAFNAGVEAKAQAVEAGAPLADGQAAAPVLEAAPEPLDDPMRDQILALPEGAKQDALRAYAVLNRPDAAKGVQQYNRKLLDRLLAENAPAPALGNADPLGMNREAQANSLTNITSAAERRPPMPASDAARMLDEAQKQGLDLAVAEHPAGGFVLVPPQWVTPEAAEQGRARLDETLARMQRADAAPVERAPRTRTDAVELSLNTDPVQNYVDGLRQVNTPAARAYAREFDAGRITPDEVLQRIQAEQGKTPDQRIAQAAAEAPKPSDPVAERLSRAAAQGQSAIAPTDLLNPSGLPFKTKMAADRAARKSPGAVVPVDGGFVVRPQGETHVQDAPPPAPGTQAEAAPAEAPQAVGEQPAGPAAGVPAAGAAAVEAAGLTYEQRNAERVARAEAASTQQEWDAITAEEHADPERDFSGTDHLKMMVNSRKLALKPDDGVFPAISPSPGHAENVARWAQEDAQMKGKVVDGEASQPASSDERQDDAPTVPVATDLTPKQYHTAKLEYIAADTGATLVEVRESYDSEAGRAEHNREWAAAVEAAAQGGQVLTRQTLDKLFELSPNAQLPEAAIPAGYQKSRARKAEAEEKQVRVANRKATKADATISDFGEKIGGARKDAWSGFKEDLNQVGDADIAAQPLSKIWPAPEYQKLIDAGTNAKAVAAVRALRDEVPAKPRTAWKVKRWAEQVKTLRGLANDVMDGKITVQDMERMGADKTANLRGMLGRVELYELVGHEKSLEGVRFAKHHYTLYKGRQNVSLWVVEKDSSATVFGNWPAEIAVGDTKDEALAAFKRTYASLNLDKVARKASFDIFSERTVDGFFVGKKIGRNYAKLEGPFKTTKEARAYREGNTAALEEKLERYKEIPRERANVNQPRVGQDMRNGQDVTPQMFGDTFGFKGVEFGNWVEQKRRQKDLNDAFDALMDMAAVLDIPPKAISLNGQLGLAFGARGSGGVNPAAAHYESDKVVINLTKKEGAGSLGHEWWHALDNYFAKPRTQGDRFMTTSMDVGLASRGANYVPYAGVRKEMIDAFGAVVNAINQTAMKARASRLDSKRTKEYWTTGEEMSARAFESYLIAKLQDQNASNDYLANVVSEKTWDAMAALGMENEGSYPYPTAAEVPAIRAGFDHFFQTVETKETEGGNVALFSRRADTRAAYEARIDALFAGEKQSPRGVRVLDRSDVLALLGMGDGPVHLVEGKVEQGRLNHALTAQDWKKVPEWLENPVAVFDSETSPGRLVFIAPELVNGAPVRMIIDPRPDGGGVNLLINAYEAVRNPFQRWEREGLLRYFDQQKAPLITGSFQPRLTGLPGDKGRSKILTQKHLAGYRRANDPAFSAAGARAEDAAAPSADSDARNVATQKLVDGLKAKWTSAPEIIVARNMQDAQIPGSVRDYDLELKSQGATGEARGFIYKGKVYLLSDELQGSKQIAEVLFHEVLGHYGLRGAFGDGLKPILQQLGTLRRKEVLAKAREYGMVDKDLGDAEAWAAMGARDRLSAAEEVLAEMAQTQPNIGFVKRAIAAIRTWLRANVPGFRSLALTDSEIIRSFILPARGYVTQSQETPQQSIARAAGVSRGESAGAPMFSRSKLAGLKTNALDQIHQTLSHPGKVSLWDKTVGTMRHLSERNPAFKPVFESAQRHIDDVSTMANDAADHAPRILPRLEEWRDLGKKPVAAADNKAIGKALFEGTLSWGRDADGKPVLVSDLEKKYANLDAEAKAKLLMASGQIDAGVLKMWRGLPLAQFEGLIGSRFESKMLKAGVVWSDKELRDVMGLNDQQVGLYREARAAIDRSIDMTSRASMLRLVGERYAGLRDVLLEQPTLQDAMDLLTSTLVQDAKAEPDASDLLMQQHNQVVDLATKARDLMDAGYMPLSRFGQYTLDVVDAAGERQYFGMFESKREANLMARQMRTAFPGAHVEQGTMSAQAFKLFQGVTPESLEMFGNMLGLDSQGNEAKDKAFQAYLQLAKNNHSAMKRLIHRKGIAGYSEDVGRTLASFVYSNARQAAGALNAGTMEKAIEAIPKTQGELRDVAMGLRSYIQDPQEEGQAVRGMLFAQYLGGSVASAFVNMTQPFAVTLPWLSQFGGMRKAGKHLAGALKDMGSRGFQYEVGLAQALKTAEEDGTVSPQEIHQLMAQSRGSGSLRSGDGTRTGDVRAGVANAWERTKVAWGQPFALAEQFNRRSTFIAAYRLARENGNANPAGFARKAVLETQFLYSKANKMRWARGAVGGALMTFKTYSVSYLELLQRTWNAGAPGSPERAAGRRAVGWAMVMLMLMGGAGGVPFAEDAEDLIDALAQLMGYNVSSKQWRKQAMADILGKELAEFLDQGISGLPGSPIDVSGRLGMGNLIPGTGLFQTKQSHTRDMLELAGPAGDLVGRAFSGAGRALKGDVAGAALEMAPAAVRNAAKGVDMAATGMYRDTKGYKVLDTTLAEAAAKFVGFQAKSVAEVQEANSFMMRSKSFYTQTSGEISAQWAKAMFEKDEDALQAVRARLEAWNRNNPEQKIVVKMPNILKRVREMGKDRTQRIADSAPKALRQKLRGEVAAAQ